MKQRRWAVLWTTPSATGRPKAHEEIFDNETDARQRFDELAEKHTLAWTRQLND